MFRVLSLIFAVSVVAACTHQVPVDVTVKAPSSAQSATAINRTVGLYISEDFRTATFTEGAFGDSWVFPIGQASAKAIEDAAGRVFLRVVPISQPPGPGVSGQFDAVLEPRIENFALDVPFLKTSAHRAEVTYLFTLYDAGSVPVAAWTVSGVGESPGGFTFSYTKWPAEAANRAIEDAMRKFVEGTADEPEIRIWLDRTSPAPTG